MVEAAPPSAAAASVEGPPRWRLTLAAVVFVALAACHDLVFYDPHAVAADGDDDHGGWNTTHSPALDAGATCTVPRVDGWELTREEFEQRYLERQPVILELRGPNRTRHEELRRRIRREVLESSDRPIVVSSADRHSSRLRSTTLRAYLRDVVSTPQPLDTPASDTWYHFGGHHHGEWSDTVFPLYDLPSKFLFTPHVALSFGIGPSGSGVPFHTHGPVFAEVFYGQKRWWLRAPEQPSPRQDPGSTTLQWLHHTRPAMTAAETDGLLECICAPGDVLYIPSHWHHATLNLGETVFISAFV